MKEDYHLHGLHHRPINSLRKTVGKASPILVTLTSRSDSDVESSNVNLKENKPDGVNPNSKDIDYYVRKNDMVFGRLNKPIRKKFSKGDQKCTDLLDLLHESFLLLL